jgi:4-hydroxybenzoate polyprenyltransferase
VLHTIRQFLSLIRFSHTLFALPFALLAAMMAWRMQAIDAGPMLGWAVVESADDGTSVSLMQTQITNTTVAGITIPTAWLNNQKFVIRWEELVGILLSMVFARSAAMAFNRLADRLIDAQNPRTAMRHLPAGALTAGQVTIFAATASAAFVLSTLLFLPNRLPLYCSVPLLLFLLGYSYAKRFTLLSHFWLGTALALSPAAAWIAIRGDVVLARPGDLLPALVLGSAVLAWVAGFDMIYATQDVDFDRQTGLHSVPAQLGVAGALRLAAACHLATIGFLAALPLAFPAFGWVWWAGVAAVAGLLVYEHALVRPDDLGRVNTAFFNVNAVISLGLLAVGILDLALAD